MVCIGHGDIDWDAVGALGSFVASAVALFVAWLGLKAPEWSKRADRLQATHEILAATDEALALYEQARQLAVEEKRWPTEDATFIRIRASHLMQTLNQLIARPALTDGAIAVGAGAISILTMLASLETHEEMIHRKQVRSKPTNSIERQLARLVDAATPARQAIEAAKSVVEVVQDRMERVKRYLKIT